MTPKTIPESPIISGTGRLALMHVTGTTLKKLLLTVSGFFLLYVLVAFFLLERFPDSGDEYAYLLQAKIFVSGRLSVPSVPREIRECFTLDHVIDDGRVRSKYPPGWPLLLCMTEPLGLSWCLNPLLAAMTLYFLFRLLALLLNTKSAWIGLVATGASPFFLFNSASYFSHTSALLFFVLALYLFVRGQHAGRTSLFVAAGLAAGFTVCIRPLDGAAALFSLLLLAVLFRNGRACAAAAAGMAPMVLACAWYHLVQFGGPLTSGYDVYRPTLARLMGATDVTHDFSFANIRYHRAHLLLVAQFCLWIMPGAALLLPLGAWRLVRTGSAAAGRAFIFGAGLLAFLFTVLQFVVPDAGDSYGPRYLFLWLVPAALFLAAGAEFIMERMEPKIRLYRATAAVVLAALLTVAVIAVYGRPIREKIVERSRLYHIVKEECRGKSLVLLRNTDYYAPRWYTRNGINYRDSTVFAVDLGPERDRLLSTYYPEYHVYQYRDIVESPLPEGARTGDRLPKVLVPYSMADEVPDEVPDEVRGYAESVPRR